MLFFVPSLSSFNFFFIIIQNKTNLERGGFKTDAPPTLSAEA